MPQLVYFNDCAVNNVTTSAYFLVVASTPVYAQSIQFVYNETAGALHTILLAVGPIGQEVNICVNSNSVATVLNYPIPAGSRISMKSADTLINAGTISLSLFPASLVPVPIY